MISQVYITLSQATHTYVHSCSSTSFLDWRVPFCFLRSNLSSSMEGHSTDSVFLPYFANSSVTPDFQHQLCITAWLTFCHLLLFTSYYFTNSKNVNVKFYINFYTLDLIITIVTNVRGCKHAQLLAEHKYLHIVLQVCECTCVHVPAGKRGLFCSVHFQKKFAR